MLVYIGTYTHGASQGIYAGELDLASGRLTVADTAAAVLDNPSFLASHPQRHHLYAVSEVDAHAERPGGSVHAFALDPGTGRLTFLNRRPSGGAHPCHVSVDPAGRFVLVANYSGGTVALLPLEADGRLAERADVVSHEGAGPHPDRQDRPHAHAIILDPAGRYALAADLGIDKILAYEIDAVRGRLVPRGVAGTATPGAGPRHLAFHPDRRRLYSLNELHSTVTAWEYAAAEGRLREIETVSALPDVFGGPSIAADIHVHPSGRLVYASNRGHDSLTVFAIDAETGRLTPRGHVPAGGQTPRNFAIDPTGTYLLVAHQDTDSVATFAIDAHTGALRLTGDVVRVPNPVCIELVNLP